jgi:hypothetical protein
MKPGNVYAHLPECNVLIPAYRVTDFFSPCSYDLHVCESIALHFNPHVYDF